jgi:hypothetical protein
MINKTLQFLRWRRMIFNFYTSQSELKYACTKALCRFYPFRLNRTPKFEKCTKFTKDIKNICRAGFLLIAKFIKQRL